MNQTCLEVCVDSYASALAAIRGGARRLELCTCLLAGGLTPDPVLLEQIKRVSSIPVRCLMRPRFGDFLYSEDEIALMEEQMRRLCQAGADGFVIGCLTPEGDLDLAQMQRLVRAAGGRGLTLHRAFDVCRDGLLAARQAADLGIDTILTSGQAASCMEGQAFLRTLLEAKLPITIMAGAGVSARVIRDMELPIRTFHMSGKVTLPSGMVFRREGVPMGLPGIDEFSVWQTDEERVRQAALALRDRGLLSPEAVLFARKAWEAARPGLGSLGQALQERLEAFRGTRRALLELALGTLPASDVASVPFEVLESYADHACFLREHSPYCRDIPDDIFLHCVYYPRINSEDLADCRPFFYEKLAPLVEGLEGREAVLAVNLWCARHMTYEMTDTRSINPLTAYSCGLGRCGEESTFGVTALRSVGIPARQIYVPWWSHCDDNHAWVEAYVEGRWHFLGACEPEPRLDLGWFLSASSRAMVVCSRNYFPYVGEGLREEPLLQKNGICLAYNQIRRYGVTANLTVTVEDREGRPVPGAWVRFYVENMASLAQIAALETDGQGQVQITMGLGSCLAEAQAGSLFAWAPMTLTENTSLRLRPVHTAPPEGTVDWDFTAPAAGPGKTLRLTPEEAARKTRELEEARKAREERQRRFRCETGVSGGPDREKILSGAGAHGPALRAFCEKYGTEAEALLLSLRPKDWRDAPVPVLEAHLLAARQLPGREDPDFLPYVACPRIGYELLTDWRTPILKALSPREQETFRRDPAALWAWICARFREDGRRWHPVLWLQPGAALRLGGADQRGRRLLFVAILRTLGRPARLDPVDGRAQYRQDGVFVTVEASGPAEPQGLLRLSPSRGFGRSWGLSRWEGGWISLELEGEDPAALALPLGLYCLHTVNRLPSGSQLIRQETFSLTGEKVLTLSPREAEPRQLLADYPVILPVPARGLELQLYPEVGAEPTEHIFNELSEARAQAEALIARGLRVRILLPREEDRRDPVLAKLLSCLEQIQVQTVDFADPALESLARSLYLEPGVWPLLVLTDGKTGFYGHGGYAVGTADLALRLAELLLEP